MNGLLPPEIVGCYFNRQAEPPLPAMRLRWDSRDAGAHEQRWTLPGGQHIAGPEPQHFGFILHRLDTDRYRLHLQWDGQRYAASDLTAAQIADSSLPEILRAIGTDLCHLLDQPITPEPRCARAA